MDRFLDGYDINDDSDALYDEDWVAQMDAEEVKLEKDFIARGKFVSRGAHDVAIKHPDYDTAMLPLTPSRKIRDHSPTGFSWGYGGSGPSQLALAIMLYMKLSDEEASQLYDHFKWSVIANLPREWELPLSEVQDWIDHKRKENGHASAEPEADA